MTHMKPAHFSENDFSPRLAELLAEKRCAALGPGEPNRAARSALVALKIDEAFLPHRVADPVMAQAAFAGIWLYHDFLDESHRISQNIPTITGSFWHGIMHRREPDSWNSKYWFERVGPHPVFPQLCDRARELAAGAQPLPETDFLREQKAWDPFRFIDLCEASREGGIPAENLCREIQMAEWRLLFEFSYRRAIGI